MGKGLGEVVQQGPPRREDLGAPEADGVVLEALPLHQQDVTVVGVEAATQLEAVDAR